MWERNGYESSNVSMEMDDEDEESDEESVDLSGDGEGGKLPIKYVRGDVTHPINISQQNAIVVHCIGRYLLSLFLFVLFYLITVRTCILLPFSSKAVKHSTTQELAMANSHVKANLLMHFTDARKIYLMHGCAFY